MSKADLSKITVKGYKTQYAVYDFGSGKRCAWCDRLMSDFLYESEHLTKEDLLAKIEEAFNGEELLWGDFQKLKEEILHE